MAQLLVSVRSAREAVAAVAGGASIIDVKEPSRGPLGRSDWPVWRAVRQAVAPAIPVSVALGELHEWLGPDRTKIPPDAWAGIAFRKLGLAHAAPDWREQWRGLRDRFDALALDPPNGPGARPSWIAVVYLDWEIARAPDPDSVIQASETVPGCSGVLFDTWDKSRRTEIDSAWAPRMARAREMGRIVALAGSLDEAMLRQPRHPMPDVFAVRAAACQRGDRRAPIDPDRVKRLVAAANRE